MVEAVLLLDCGPHRLDLLDRAVLCGHDLATGRIDLDARHERRESQSLQDRRGHQCLAGRAGMHGVAAADAVVLRALAAIRQVLFRHCRDCRII